MDMQEMNWCVEHSATITKASPNLLQIEDKKDGLFFVADVKFEPMNLAELNNKRDEIESNKQRYKLQNYTKGDIFFYHFSQRSPTEGKLSKADIVNGEVIGIRRDGTFTIAYRGVNLQKVERYIALLME